MNESYVNMRHFTLFEDLHNVSIMDTSKLIFQFEGGFDKVDATCSHSHQIRGIFFPFNPWRTKMSLALHEPI